ncbi:DUF4440 domain-containing protein [Endozoicomonas sp. SM1973]|uniref:DUF4440 domain-containing protein n=1 Tax=Spartinivicinus marinus TaxID=2994442 RepID=A0A853IKT4_9GAMM|nr:ketosteroid isomerase family protein [Spartinivicinus marinus]NYZ69685.1 DUF4440 domain-containing protein [Spartinivicinus marinus]
MANMTNVLNEITAADETFMSTFMKGDAAGIAALYTVSAQFLPPNGDVVLGRDAIQATFQALMV